MLINNYFYDDILYYSVFLFSSLVKYRIQRTIHQSVNLIFISIIIKLCNFIGMRLQSMVCLWLKMMEALNLHKGHLERTRQNPDAADIGTAAAQYPCTFHSNLQ